MRSKPAITAELIAPCGMNCATCLAYLRQKNHCPGCRADDAGKPKTCVECIIKNCEALKSTGSKYCSVKCEKYPCRRLRNLDKRYRAKYHMSMIENLGSIGELGIRAFVRNEKARWTCPDCGGLICVHRGFCFNCGRALEESLM